MRGLILFFYLQDRGQNDYPQKTGEKMDPIDGDHPIYWDIRKDLGEEVFEE